AVTLTTGLCPVLHTCLRHFSASEALPDYLRRRRMPHTIVCRVGGRGGDRRPGHVGWRGGNWWWFRRLAACRHTAAAARDPGDPAGRRRAVHPARCLAAGPCPGAR